jgi:hypothetical protein
LLLVALVLCNRNACVCSSIAASRPPVLALGCDHTHTHTGYSLSLRRLSIVGARLARKGNGMPVLYPQGLFETAPTNLTMMDVRLVVSDGDFKACLAFFADHFQSIRTADDNGVGMHTVCS